MKPIVFNVESVLPLLFCEYADNCSSIWKCVVIVSRFFKAYSYFIICGGYFIKFTWRNMLILLFLQWFFFILDTVPSKTTNMRRLPTYLPFYRTLGSYSKKLHRNFMSKSVRFRPSYFLDLGPNATSKRNYNFSWYYWNLCLL